MKLNRVVAVLCLGLYSCSPSNTYVIEERSTGYKVVLGKRSFFRAEDNTVSIDDFRETQTFLHEHFHYITTLFPPSEEFKAECVRLANNETYIDKKAFVLDTTRKYLESTYNALSKGRIRLNYIHPNSYWNDENNIWKEVYANLLVIRATGRWSQIRELENDFPSVIKLFLEDVKYHGIK